MADAQDGEMSGLTNSFDGLSSEKPQDQLIEHWEGLVVNELSQIHDKYFNFWNSIECPREPRAHFEETAIRNHYLAHLQSKSLPSICRRVTSLSEILLLRRSDPPIINQPMPVVCKLELILKAVRELATTLDEIKSAIPVISPALDITEMRYDQDCKQLKLFKSARIALSTYTVTGLACELLRISCQFIEESRHRFCEDCLLRHKIECMALNCSEAVNQTLIFIKKSEVNVLQDAWKVDIESIDDSLEKFVKLLNQAESQLDAEDTDRQLSDTTISVISIIKLWRLFLVKLLKMSADKGNLTMIGDLSSRELELFFRFTKAVSVSVAKLVDTVCEDSPEADLDDQSVTIRRSISDMLSAPRVILLIIQHAFRPVHPNQLSFKIHLKAWFYEWNKLHHLAARNFLGELGLTLP